MRVMEDIDWWTRLNATSVWRVRSGDSGAVVPHRPGALPRTVAAGSRKSVNERGEKGDRDENARSSFICLLNHRPRSGLVLCLMLFGPRKASGPTCYGPERLYSLYSGFFSALTLNNTRCNRWIRKYCRERTFSEEMCLPI